MPKSKPKAAPRRLPLWVVEVEYGPRWEPTVGVAITREGGRKELRLWQSRSPGLRLRLAKYVRADR